jgi:hypothetical protein
MLKIKAIIFGIAHVFIGFPMVFGQKPIQSIPNYFKSDTCFTFDILTHNNDEVLQKLIHKLSTPKQASAGQLVWENISIPYIGKNLKIVLKDGAFLIDKENAYFTPFQDEKSKADFLKRGAAPSFRKTEILVFFNEKNAITNTALEGRMVKFLENIIE